MSKVGIIANPASGKDIRRLVAFASVMDNGEKANLVRRVILGIDSTGVDEIIIMPDYCGLGTNALSGVGRKKINAKVSILDMPVTGTPQDSAAAVKLMAETGVQCIVTVGGDGTNRAVAKGDRSVPLIPVSTGTNNVFPVMVEGTTAGIAAGIVALDAVDTDEIVSTHKRLTLLSNGAEIDMALVDIAVMNQPFIGSRAVWKLSEVKQVICTRAEPDSIGLSCIGGTICPVEADDDYGLHLELGKGGLRARAAILPGIVQEVGITEHRLIKIGEEVELKPDCSLIALDGERELSIGEADRVKVKLMRDGPRVVDINKTINKAVAKSFFASRN